MPGLAPPVSDERSALLAYLAQQRDVLRIAAHGLTDEQARATPTDSSLSVGGLVKHAAAAERNWVAMARQQPRASAADYADGFRLGPDETLAWALAGYVAAAAETDALVRASELDAPVPVPQGVPWFPSDVEAWSIRWVLLHLIAETARHAGHADIVRESIDGASAFALMAAAEGWPASSWVRPWSPRRRAVASFVIDSWDQQPYDSAPGADLTRTRVAKTFSGDVAGTSTAELLMAVSAGGAMSYVGHERIEAAVQGRRGAFVLRHSAYGDASHGSGRWSILDGSGVGELAGITGSALIDRHDDGSHTFTLEYELPAREPADGA